MRQTYTDVDQCFADLEDVIDKLANDTTIDTDQFDYILETSEEVCFSLLEEAAFGDDVAAAAPPSPTAPPARGIFPDTDTQVILKDIAPAAGAPDLKAVPVPTYLPQEVQQALIVKANKDGMEIIVNPGQEPIDDSWLILTLGLVFMLCATALLWRKFTPS